MRRSLLPTPNRSDAGVGTFPPFSPVSTNRFPGNLNSFASETSEATPYPYLPRLYPLDKYLVPAIQQIASFQEVSTLLKSYGMSSHRLTRVSDSSSLNPLVERFIGIRCGNVGLTDSPIETQIEILALGNINLKDSDPVTLEHGKARFLSYWGPSHGSVALQPHHVWQSLTVDCIKAHLGILGFPVPGGCTKAGLLDCVHKAQVLSVYQGHSIPQMVAPFFHFRFPDSALLEFASPAFLITLASSARDPADPVPTPEEATRIIRDFPGLMIDGSIFDDALWACLGDAIDRRLFLQGFGIPFPLTAALSASELLPLLPRDLPADMPYERIAPPVPHRRPNLLQALATVSRVASSGITPGSTAAGPPHGTALTQMSDVDRTSISTPIGMNPLLAALPNPTTHLTPLLTAPGTTVSSLATLPLPTDTTQSGTFHATEAFDRVATHVPRALAPFFATVNSAPCSAAAETRLIRDYDGIAREYTFDELTALTTPALQSMVAAILSCHPSQIPLIQPQQMASYIWQETKTLGFQFLLASSPDLARRYHADRFDVMIWPTSTDIIIVLHETTGPGGLLEAMYATPTVKMQTVAATVHRTGGCGQIFPADGSLPVGSLVVVPRGPRSGNHRDGILGSTVSGAATGSDVRVDNITQSQLTVAETLGKANRKASEGTRILQDVLHGADAIRIFSAAPIIAGKQMLYTVLFNVISETPIQCPLYTVAALARGFTSIDPNQFVSLRDAMDDDSARDAARPFLEHRSEQKYPGTLIPLWNNDPARLRTALANLFTLWGTLVLAHDSVAHELHEIATRTFHIARALPDWTTDNNSYFWNQVLTQVGDVITAIGRKPSDSLDSLLTTLRGLPDFTTRYGPRTHLELLRLEAHRKLLAKSASQAIVAPSNPTLSAALPSTITDTTGANSRNRPFRQHRRNDSAKTPSPAYKAEPITATSSKSSSPCARHNSTSGCPDEPSVCRFAHIPPSSSAVAGRLCRIIEAKGLTPTPALRRLADAEPPVAVKDGSSGGARNARGGERKTRGKRNPGGARAKRRRDEPEIDYDGVAWYSHIPVLRSSFRVPGEPAAGDCGPAAVIALLRMAARLYPSCFYDDVFPNTVAEVRATLAYLLIDDLIVSTDDIPIDHWVPTLFPDEDNPSQGDLPAHILNRLPDESASAHRRRIASAVTYSETSLLRPKNIPVFWFTPPIIETLLRYYIQKAFRYGPDRDIVNWLRLSSDISPIMSVGPFCVTNLDPRYCNNILSRATSGAYSKNFQFICIYTGNHFISFLNSSVVPIGDYPVDYAPDIGFVEDIFFPNVNDDASPDGVMSSVVIDEPGGYPYHIRDVMNHFPYIFDFLEWDLFIHTFEVSHAHNEPLLAITTHDPRGWSPCQVLPSLWVRDREFFVIPVEKLAEPANHGLAVYSAFVGPSRKLYRALYTLQRFDGLLDQWCLQRREANDPLFPTTIHVPSQILIVAIRFPGQIPDSVRESFPVRHGITDPWVQSFFESSERQIPIIYPMHGQPVPASPHVTTICLDMDTPNRALTIPSTWNFSIGPSTYLTSQQQGVFLVPSDGALPILTGTSVMRLRSVREAPVDDIQSLDEAVMLDTGLGPPFFVTRISFSPVENFLPNAVSGDEQLYMPNCTWRIESPNSGSDDLARSNSLSDDRTISLITTEDITGVRELFLIRTWFADPPEQLCPAARESTLRLHRSQLTEVRNTVIRQHLLRMAEGLPQMRLFLTHAWEYPGDSVH